MKRATTTKTETGKMSSNTKSAMIQALKTAHCLYVNRFNACFENGLSEQAGKWYQRVEETEARMAALGYDYLEEFVG